MLTIWFMYDNHTFGKVTGHDRDTLVKQARGFFRADGCGSLFVRDEWGGSLEGLTLHGHRLGDSSLCGYGVLPEEIEKWADAVVAERSFQTLMA